MFSKILENLISFRRVPVKIVVITALTSYILQVGTIILGYPLYIIAVITLLPWIPVVAFEGLWKVEHYSWIAVFGIIVILQLGHMGEHVTQVSQLAFFNGTLACPPPVDNIQAYNLAVENDLRSPNDSPTGLSSVSIIRPDAKTGLPLLGENGQEIVGPAACGVLGQLDIEVVHLVWEVLGWILTLWLITKFPRNIWLWVALVAVSLHGIEHLFISYLFFIDKDTIYQGAKQLWATTADGALVTAHPVGLKSTLVNFYAAGGKNGIMGAGGLVENLLGVSPGALPARPYLHFWYNAVVFTPTIIAFFVEIRRTYDEYLAQALPELSEQQLIETTPKLASRRFKDGETIIRQGDPANEFYIVVKGEVHVIRDEKGTDFLLSRIGPGSYFGEIGLMNNDNRMASVYAHGDVEVMVLGRQHFSSLMNEAEMSKDSVRSIVQERIKSTREIIDGEES